MSTRPDRLGHYAAATAWRCMNSSAAWQWEGPAIIARLKRMPGGCNRADEGWTRRGASASRHQAGCRVPGMLGVRSTSSGSVRAHAAERDPARAHLASTRHSRAAAPRRCAGQAGYAVVGDPGIFVVPAASGAPRSSRHLRAAIRLQWQAATASIPARNAVQTAGGESLAWPR